MEGERRALLSVVAPGPEVPVAFETNGRGWLGFLVRPPGAFVRGPTRREALLKTDPEVRSYLRWAGVRGRRRYIGRVAEVRRTRLKVEDADREFLLGQDRGPVDREEFAVFRSLILRSARSFQEMWDGVQHPGRVEPGRVRGTFWGRNPATPREVYDHVFRTQSYYLSRLGLEAGLEGSGDFVSSRVRCLAALQEGWRAGAGTEAVEVSRELWTLRKVLRRLLWHDRIHARALFRMLERQAEEGTIRSHADPFFFRAALTPSTSRT